MVSSGWQVIGIISIGKNRPLRFFKYSQKYDVYVVVKFLIQVIFVFLLFFGMVMYANEVETKEK